MSIDWGDCTTTLTTHNIIDYKQPRSSSDRSAKAFDWLCQLQSSFGGHGARLVEVEDRRWLRLDNHVSNSDTLWNLP